jgi:hypothetical protein
MKRNDDVEDVTMRPAGPGGATGGHQHPKALILHLQTCNVEFQDRTSHKNTIIILWSYLPPWRPSLYSLHEWQWLAIVDVVDGVLDRAPIAHNHLARCSPEDISVAVNGE